MQAFSFSAPRFTEEDEIRELAAMTEAELEEVRHDLYGTHTEMEETDELRETCLEQVQQCLDEIPDDEKQVYLEALQACPELVSTESAPIRFLRSENYQPEVRMGCVSFVLMLLRINFHSSFSIHRELLNVWSSIGIIENESFQIEPFSECDWMTELCIQRMKIH